MKILTSAGIDIGSTTSHLVFSRLVLEKDPNSITEKFEIRSREILYRGRIILTPLLRKDNELSIDFDSLSRFLEEEYKRANLSPEDIDTGAVVVTGETARRENAEKVVNLVAHDAGNFVGASAGPNFEAFIAAKGSGAVEISRKNHKTILNVDIGGGTSNLAIVQNGRIVDTCCVNVGARLLVFSSHDGLEVLDRIEKAGRLVCEHENISLKIGEPIPVKLRQKIAGRLSECLLEVINRQIPSDLTKKLLMTAPLSWKDSIDELIISGGVAEFIFNDHPEEVGNFHDLGLELGQVLREKVEKSQIPLTQPTERIRATVIGAGAYTLSVSGSTTYLSKELSFPLRNVPVVTPRISGTLSAENISNAIKVALEKLDFTSKDLVALAFGDPVRTVYKKLIIFSQGVVKAMGKGISPEKPLIMVFEKDIGNSVGNVMRRETSLRENILSIDEISLEEGDFIDIGKPVIEGKVVPVVVKSLVFEQ